jgi:hypothetical protein
MNFINNFLIKHPPIKYVGFENVKLAIQQKYIIINTLSNCEQDNLIKTTIDYKTEESIINDMITGYEFAKPILIYGKNATDSSAENKCGQLQKLGFKNIMLYKGGLFEWMLLQDIYGVMEFPTTKPTLDILLYKPPVV